MITINHSHFIFTFEQISLGKLWTPNLYETQSAGAVEYAAYISAEG